MTWLEQLGDGLAAAGITGSERARILDEFGDHIACEPGCEPRLGDPARLAARFADELAGSRARRSAFDAVGALAGVAAVLAVSQLTMSAAGGPPGFDHGHSLALFILAALGMLVASQVALVTGTLAAWRSVRRHRAVTLPAAELVLIRRRTWIALGAGWATLAGIALYVIDFSARLPSWWVALVGGLVVVAAVGMAAATRALIRAGDVVCSAPGSAGDLYDDLPPVGRDWLRRHPWRLGALTAVIVGVGVTLVIGHAERSLVEGLQRGIPEALAVAGGFLLFGRAIGAFSPSAGHSGDGDHDPA